MKKFITLILALMMITLCACSAEEKTDSPAVDDNPITTATEFSFTAKEGEELVLENLLFNEDVTVSGDYGTVIFTNCQFKGNITNTASLGTKVVLDNSTVDGKCIIEHDGKEATFETSLPKFVTSTPIDVVCEDCFGSAIVLGDFEITFNGETYSTKTAEFFYNGDLVPYEGQEVTLLDVCQWWENDELVLMAFAEE